MNKKKIEEILELMEKYGLTEMDIEEEGLKVHLKKGISGIETVIQPASGVKQIIQDPVQGITRESSKEESNLVDIKAPMVGTFYKAPSPDAPPYVEVGTAIKEGDVLCILEAMKLMNEIKSEVNGVIKEVLIENGHPIEFGQVLFRVEPK